MQSTVRPPPDPIAPPARNSTLPPRRPPRSPRPVRGRLTLSPHPPPAISAVQVLPRAHARERPRSRPELVSGACRADEGPLPSDVPRSRRIAPRSDVANVAAAKRARETDARVEPMYSTAVPSHHRRPTERSNPIVRRRHHRRVVHPLPRRLFDSTRLDSTRLDSSPPFALPRRDDAITRHPSVLRHRGEVSLPPAREATPARVRHRGAS